MKNVTNPYIPEKHPKGWGYEIWVTNTPEYCGKILHFEEGKKCSFHYHKRKHEHFFVVSGRFLLKFGWDDNYENSVEKVIFRGEAVEIPIGMRHQMIALESGDLMEVSTEHFEDDSFRVIPGDSIEK